MAAKIEYVNERVLDPKLRSLIYGKLDKTEALNTFRRKDVPITFDDLDEYLRYKINSGGGTPGDGKGYDDTELRNRIIFLENNAALKAELASYLKKTDAIKESQLDSAFLERIQQIETNIRHQNDLIVGLNNTKANREELNNYRKSTAIEKIKRSELDQEIQQILSIAENGGIPPAILGQIENLQRNKADRNELTNYRRIDNPITEDDLSANLKDALNNVLNVLDLLAGKADRSELNNYRLKSVKIAEGDIDAYLLDKINTAYNAAQSNEDVVRGIVNGLLAQFRNEMYQYYGDKTLLDQNFKDELSGEDWTVPEALTFIYNTFRRADEPISITRGDLDPSLANELDELRSDIDLRPTEDRIMEILNNYLDPSLANKLDELRNDVDLRPTEDRVMEILNNYLNSLLANELDELRSDIDLRPTEDRIMEILNNYRRHDEQIVLDDLGEDVKNLLTRAQTGGISLNIERSIPAGSYVEINIMEELSDEEGNAPDIFVSAKHCYIDVRVLDNNPSSPTYNMFINSEGVATVAFYTNEEDESKLPCFRVYNDHDENLTFNILVRL